MRRRPAHPLDRADHRRDRDRGRRRDDPRLEGAAVDRLRLDQAGPGRGLSSSGSRQSFRDDAEVERIRRTHADDDEQQVARLADLFAEQVETGQGIGRIKIPGIDVDDVVVQGTDTASLQKGPGHYPETGFPGQGKTIGIAGHRTTYLAPFRHINEVADGDEIELEMPYGTFTYAVEKHEIVDPSQVEIVDDVGYERLVLTACHPLYSAAQRWAVFAKLTDVSAAGG